MKRIPSLEALGMTRLEAVSYAFLVANPASTGYGVSKGIGKPTANVYRALESLERKGAVRNDRGSPPKFRAVPPAELLDQLEREFMDRRAIASTALAALEAATDRDDDADGMFALATAEQVTGRTRLMLTAARRIALVDAGPDAFDLLSDAVDDARSRRVRVLVRVRGPAQAGHPDTIAVAAGDAAGEGAIRAVMDAREALIARLDADAATAREAVWTRSPLFVRTLHDALATELFYTRIERGLSEGLSVDELEGFYEECRRLRSPAD